jgi:hypothetical protein
VGACRGPLTRSLLRMLCIVCSRLLKPGPSGIYTLAAEEFCFDGKDIMGLLVLAKHVSDGRAQSLHPVTLLTRL